MVEYNIGSEFEPELAFEERDAVAVVANLIEDEGEISYYSLSRVVKKRLAPILEELYAQGKVVYHIGLASKRDVLVGEELVKFKKSHPKVKIILFETTYFPCEIKGFSESDVRRYYKVADCADVFVHHPINYGEDLFKTLNVTFAKSVRTVIAYGDCESSRYFYNRGYDVRYLLTLS